ncbi:Tetrathionate reductase subunit C [Dissulfuribacter thermophilus]|uniref:Tetrathionate reductase subunit C n=1 Tax=Dissulfuribacter thermophilus TaxID=1156395 RepID=A0A1B9F360_9BACT|nr:NrfD/PsrC family molybdoenzyme membrane anchor subunit [Dissulfuribacter thermophilus]OCC14255.1 Tetrathionate reductase subunit C [Dissulfuribacter thermophilus]
MTELTGFILPNEHHVHWSFMIVLYPYITGIIAGAFIVSSLYHVFNIKALKPVSRFSLVFAFAFWTCCTLPLLNHLGHPERAFKMLITPSPTSAMAGFGYIYGSYGLLLIMEILLVYRETLVDMYHRTQGVLKKLYWLLTFGVTQVTPQSREADKKVIKFLAAIGIPWACTLHGYVGFIFGGVKAVHWWFTPLMPVVFLLSASVSGIAGITLLYILIMKFKGEEPDANCIKTLVKFLWGFFILDLTMELLDVGVHAYLRVEHWHIVEGLLNGPLYTTFWTLQMGVFSVIPFVLLAWLSLTNVSTPTLKFFASLVSVMILFQVILMRWNVVIGGQLISKSGRGYASFDLEFLGKEGLLAGLIILALPLVVLFILSKIFPLWHPAKPEAEAS